MSNYGVASKPLLQCLRQSYGKSISIASLQSARSFQTTTISHEEVQTTAADNAADPALVSTPPKKSGRSALVGSRRRRAALNGSENLPFELLPYQCFQEARQVLQADREEKLKAISREQARIERLQALTDDQSGNANVKRSKLGSMEKHLNNLKVWADINDPLIKRKFEDGEGTELAFHEY
jgi:large subunit ribosomal protein L35